MIWYDIFAIKKKKQLKRSTMECLECLIQNFNIETPNIIYRFNIENPKIDCGVNIETLDIIKSFGLKL